MIAHQVAAVHEPAEVAFDQAIGQSTGQSGEITLTAKSPGVTDGMVKIRAQPAPHRPAVTAD
jgi:hypothetical protein